MSTHIPTPTRRAYMVLVKATRLFLDTVEVYANTPEEAERLALENHHLDWSNSTELTVTCEVLEVRR